MLRLTAHWIAKDFEAQSTILSLNPINDHHSGVNLASHIHNSLKAFDTTEMLYCVTNDHSSKNQTMGQALEGYIPFFQCSQESCWLHGQCAQLGYQGKPCDTRKGAQVQLALPPSLALIFDHQPPGISALS